MLTYPHPPSPTAVRSTNRLRLRGSISGPWSARPQWAPTAVSFLVATHTKPLSALSHLPVFFSLSVVTSLPRCRSRGRSFSHQLLLQPFFALTLFTFRSYS